MYHSNNCISAHTHEYESKFLSLPTNFLKPGAIVLGLWPLSHYHGTTWINSLQLNQLNYPWHYSKMEVTSVKDVGTAYQKTWRYCRCSFWMMIDWCWSRFCEPCRLVCRLSQSMKISCSCAFHQLKSVGRNIEIMMKLLCTEPIDILGHGFTHEKSFTP